jgi:hypothetical protein
MPVGEYLVPDTIGRIAAAPADRSFGAAVACWLRRATLLVE